MASAMTPSEAARAPASTPVFVPELAVAAGLTLRDGFGIGFLGDGKAMVSVVSATAVVPVVTWRAAILTTSFFFFFGGSLYVS